jgi:hypothetical protein
MVRVVNRKGTATMYGLRESDSPIVSKKQPNNTDMRKSVAEVVEKRGLTKGNRLIKPKPGLSTGIALLYAVNHVRYVLFTRPT